MIGERLGDFHVLARIGRGGMGTVYLAERLSDGERVAVKVLEGKLEGDGAGLRRFAQELDTLRRIESERIVRALGPVHYDGERHYFPMEYVRGRNLTQVLEEVGRLEPGEALAIVAQALEGLMAAHQAGVLHRDLKSANLLIDEQGRVKVCDFGLARAIDQTRLTLSGALLGTPAYCSPEQAKGHDSRIESDLYSMGVVLYEALTGTLPFRAETPLALLRLHLDEEPDPPSTRCPRLPEAVDALVLRALAKAPTDRFASAERMLEEVDRVKQTLGERDVSLDMVETTVLKLVQAETVELETVAAENAPQRFTLPRPLLLAGLLLALVAYVVHLSAGPRVQASGEGSPPPSPGPTARSAASPAASPEAAPVTTEAETSPVTTEASVASVASTAATLTLAGGERVLGELLGIADGRITLRTAEGTLSFERARVTSIRYGPEGR